MFLSVSATGGTLITTTITITVRPVDRGGWKRVFPTLRLCRSGIGVKDTHNTSVVGTRAAQPAQPSQAAEDLLEQAHNVL